jgi:hypothetical protein
LSAAKRWYHEMRFATMTSGHGESTTMTLTRFLLDFFVYTSAIPIQSQQVIKFGVFFILKKYKSFHFSLYCNKENKFIFIFLV